MMTNNSNRVLTIYYSYSGNTRRVADAIHKIVGGNIVEIHPVEPYPDNYNAVVEQAKQELHSGYQPDIKAKVENIASFDTVFVGSPNWWHTIAPPVVSFLSESDLAGKTIIPLVTHGGGGLGRGALHIAELCPNSTILECIAVYGADVKLHKNGCPLIGQFNSER